MSPNKNTNTVRSLYVRLKERNPTWQMQDFQAYCDRKREKEMSKTFPEKRTYTKKQVQLLQIAFANSRACENCGTFEQPTADHIVPKMILSAFGYDTLREFKPEWYQVLCMSCNSKKAYRLDFTNPRTFRIFLSLLYGHAKLNIVQRFVLRLLQLLQGSFTMKVLSALYKAKINKMPKTPKKPAPKKVAKMASMPKKLSGKGGKMC